MQLLAQMVNTPSSMDTTVHSHPNRICSQLKEERFPKILEGARPGNVIAHFVLPILISHQLSFLFVPSLRPRIFGFGYDGRVGGFQPMSCICLETSQLDVQLLQRNRAKHPHAGKQGCYMSGDKQTVEKLIFSSEATPRCACVLFLFAFCVYMPMHRMTQSLGYLSNS
uniref:AlNc14C169G7967 protein n=1 Tax=Albugo laibachii Nc14 TaxID=890382 RepID=F0WND9_9STRA|nr:AlNc14C169G7967 [Albugo laibachii Nc14]|eukprot:CCA22830.1 AlNc14C169G7967 [Albugo laibachii Nc14]